MIENEYKLEGCNKPVIILAHALDNAFGNVTINSGLRNKEVNRLIGGASGSEHTKGNAMDVSIKDVHVYKIAGWLLANVLKYQWKRIAVNIFKNYIHIDFRDVKDLVIRQYDRNNKWM